MADIESQLKSLQNKIQSLLKQYQHLQKQNSFLKEELNHRSALQKQHTDLIQALQQKVDAFNLSASSNAKGEKIELRKRIDIYLAEIEKCISLLNE